MATLRVYRGDQFVAPFELGEGRTRIGRGTDNHLVLEDHDKQVSRIHAEIWHERGRYVIADLNSQNGVWNCTFVGYCSEVCPKHVDPAAAIQQGKVESSKDFLIATLKPR